MNRLLIAVLIVVSSSLLFSCKEPDTVSGVGGDSGGHAHPAAPPIAPPATPVDVQPVDSGITLISPNGGENWNVGETHTITWSSGSGGTLYIYLYKGGDYSETIASSTANDGSFNWTIPSSLATSSNYGIVIFSTENSDVYDLSNGDFTITNPVPTITVTSPNGGEAWVHGENRTFTWDSNNLGGSVKIDLYKSGSYDGTVTESTPNDGSFDWTILPSVAVGSGYKVRIISTTSTNVYDESDSNFSIGEGPASITVTYPNGGEEWNQGEDRYIYWNSSGLDVNENLVIRSGDVTIHLYKSGSFVLDIVADFYSSWYGQTETSVTDNGSFIWWDIPESVSGSSDYTIKISSATNSAISDSSDSEFLIGRIVDISNPSGGENWQVGETRTITWTASDNTGSTVNILLLKSNQQIAKIAGEYSTSGQQAPNNGSFAWTIPSSMYYGNPENNDLRPITNGSDYQIRIVGINTDPNYGSDISDTFTITE